MSSTHTGELSIGDQNAFVEDVRKALHTSKVVAYAQGFDQIKAGSAKCMAGSWTAARCKYLAWRVHYPRSLPRPGARGLRRRPRIALAPWWRPTSPMRSRTAGGVAAWRRVVSAPVQAGVPTPVFSSSLAYYDALRAERLPVALIQGLRDNFGAHTYLPAYRPARVVPRLLGRGRQAAHRVTTPRDPRGGPR